MENRTDLALEDGERYDRLGQRVEENGCVITTMEVTPAEEDLFGKPRGTYLTIETAPIDRHLEGETDCLPVVTKHLQSFLQGEGLVLVAGLGNRFITPDALGPKTAEGVLATRHITGELERFLGHQPFRPVVTVAPNVLGNTGVEAAELLESLVSRLKPEVVVAVDALAARSVSRLGCTVQMSTAGIAPGSGVHNNRPSICAETLGVPVIGMGIPTVVDLETFPEGEGDDLPLHRTGFLVTPREIDRLIDRGTRLLSMAINMAVNPMLDEAMYRSLL